MKLHNYHVVMYYMYRKKWFSYNLEKILQESIFEGKKNGHS